MSRDAAVIRTRRIGDPDWAALSPLAAWLYDQLLITPGVAPTGVVPLQPRQWAKRNRGTNVIALTEEIVEAVLAELAAARYVLVDRDTEEVMVRTFIRGDGIATNHRMLLALCRRIDTVQSSQLRENLAIEIERARTSLTMPTKGKGPELYEQVMRETDHAVKELRGGPPTPPPEGEQMTLGMGDSNPHRNPLPNPPARPPHEGPSQPPSQPPSQGGTQGPGDGEGDGEGELPSVPPEISKESASACVLDDHGSTGARAGTHAHTREPPRDRNPDEQRPAQVIEAHRPIGVIPPEPVTYRHGDEAAGGVDPDVARASTLTHGYLAAEPMALYERVQPHVLRAVRSGRYGHGEIAAALARLAADDRSVTVDTLRIELAGQPPARAPTPTGRRSSSAASYLALADADPDPEPWS